MKKNILLIVSLFFACFVNAAVSKTVNVTTAGELADALTSEEIVTVTNLTVIGNIDARDFKFLRDGITNLAVLDIGAVTIQAYSGGVGTSTSTFYPANEIPERSFYNITKLTSITIPNSVTSIGNYAFCYCYNLTSLTIPNSVTSIGNYAFYHCNNLEDLTIGNSVTSIGNYAFYGSGLTSITIGNSVTSIGDYAFGKCSRLTSIIIPNSVTSIGNYAFYFCWELTSITIGNSVTSIGNYAFFGCESVTDLTIGNSVVSIGISAFIYCSGLTSITIPNSVMSIGNEAFSGCSGLTSITIENSITSIEDSVFLGCSGLTSITIPNSVTSIGNSVFNGCIGLTSITIPNSVTSIGNSAFSGCSKVSTIYIYAIIPAKIGSKTFETINKYACTLYVPAGSKNAYQAATGWNEFYNIIEGQLPVTNTAIKTNDAISIFPNPVTEGFHINGMVGKGSITITDLSGKILLSKKVMTNDYIYVDFLPKGIYIVRLATNNGSVERKVLKK